jgi:hypothetical protein
MGRDELGKSQLAAKWTGVRYAWALVCMPFEGVLWRIDVEQGKMVAVPRVRKDGAEMDDMFYCRISRQNGANSDCFVNLGG